MKGGDVYDRITISGTDHCCTVTEKEDNDREVSTCLKKY